MNIKTKSSCNAIWILAIGLLLTACASSPPKPLVDFKPDYNFSAVKKVAFFEKSGQVIGDNPLTLSDMQKDRIHSALSFALRNKGLEIVDDASQADLLLSWHLVTENKTDVRTYDTPAMGPYYGYNRYSMYNCWSCVGGMSGGTDVSVSNYTQGTFIVDMIDPELRKSVWRSTTQSRLKGQLEQDQGKYNAAATNVMASFPPL